MRLLRVLVPLAVLCGLAALSQEAAKPTPPMNPFVRLTTAKSVYLKSAGGSDIPYNVISSSMEGWGRYVVVKTPEQADLIVEVTAPSDSGGSGISISSSSKTDSYGRPQDSVSSSREISQGGGLVKVTVFDAKSKAALWSASEMAKSAMRQKGREDNLVQAAEKVFTKFHDRIEPPVQ